MTNDEGKNKTRIKNIFLPSGFWCTTDAKYSGQRLVLCIVQLGSGRCLPALLLSVRQCNINSLHFPLHSLCCFCVFFCLVIFLPEGWLPVEKVWVCPLVHPNVLQVNPYGILSMFVYKPPCTRVRHALERLSGKCTNLLECPPPIPVFVSRVTVNTY